MLIFFIHFYVHKNYGGIAPNINLGLFQTSSYFLHITDRCLQSNVKVSGQHNYSISFQKIYITCMQLLLYYERIIKYEMVMSCNACIIMIFSIYTTDFELSYSFN